MRRAAALFVLPGLALATATGVSLSEFHPSVSGLSKNCESLYTSTLPGCQPSDFEPNSSGTNHCSSSCLATLNTVTQVIHHVCGDENLHGTNLISAFLAGDGTQKICPNAPGNSASSSPSTSAQQTSPSTPASSAAVQTSASSSPSTSSAAPVAASTTSAITTSASTPAGIEIDSTGSPTAPSTAASATSSSATPQQDISHGGSPFDMSNNAAGRHTPHMIPGITAALVVVLLGSLAL